MNRRDAIVGALAFGATAVRPAQGAAVPSVEEHIAEQNGYSLFFRINRGATRTAPTIILEAGGGADSSHWGNLSLDLARETGATVVSYDRPGFGKSDLPSKPYDIVEELTAFHTLLERQELASRVLIVAHSYGAFLAQIYASRWPSTVHSLLLLDPNNPSFMLAAGADGAPQPIKNAQSPRGRALSRVDAAGDAPFIATYRSQLPLDVPLIVVSAEEPPFKEPRLARAFALSHELLAMSVRDGRLVKAERSNHHVAQQRPDLVIASVKELLAKSR